MRWFNAKQQLKQEDLWQQDNPLFYFGKGKTDKFSVGDSMKHVFITGASGSGKTSGSMATILRAYLQAGYGGLVLCAKPEEVEIWQNYCKQTGREDDLIRVSTNSQWHFNFLDYELRRHGRGAGSTTNIIEVISTIGDIIENNTKESLGEDFWDRSAMQLVAYTVIILSLCREPLTMQNIEEFIVSAPYKGEKDDPAWQATSYAAQRMDAAHRAPKTPRQQGDYAAAMKYFTKAFLRLNERTRSSIEITYSSIANKFMIGDTRELLCRDTTFVPEVLWEGGKVVLLDFPISEYNKEGLLIQGIIKYSFQKALLRRNLATHPRPVFLAMDEYQNFMSSYDYRFLSEARSAGVAVIMATQNISNLYSILGGGARDQANSLLGNAATKIFHSNTDITTNSWASEVIGQSWVNMVSHSMKESGKNSGSTVSKQIHARRLPSDFATLLTGGKQNGYIVESYIVQTGRSVWQNGKVYLKARFAQTLQIEKKQE